MNPAPNTIYTCAPGVILDGQDGTQYAFRGTAANVTVRGCIIQNYASCNQCGAVTSLGTGWLIEGNEIRNNAFGGVDGGGSNTVIRGNYVHHNGQYGIAGGDGSNLLIEGNEIAYNDTKHLDATFEAGGGKVTEANGVTWRNNNVYRNSGPGIWADESVSNAVIEGNTVSENGWAGIMVEISYNTTIRNNIVSNNSSCSVAGVTCDPRGDFWRVEVLIFNAGSQTIQSQISSNSISGPGLHLAFLNLDRASFRTWNWLVQGNGLSTGEWEFFCEEVSNCNAVRATVTVVD